MKLAKYLIITMVLATFGVQANQEIRDNRYQKVAQKHQKHALPDKDVSNAKMLGECLVELEELTFKKETTSTPYPNGSTTAQNLC